MKTLSLIPFVIGLIGFDVCQKESPEVWKFGPEYIFRVGVNLSLTDPQTNKFMCSNVTIGLKCRPFSIKEDDRTDALQCHVREAELHNYEMDNALKKMIESEPQGPMLDIIDDKFEIIYEKRGIKALKISSSVSEAKLNMFRSIASHLNFGFDKFDKGGERFAFVEVVGPENSTIGECETTFEVSKQIKFKGVRWDNKCGDKLHIETFAYGDKSPMIAMDKTRNINKCTKKSPYMFGAAQEAKNRPPVLNITMVSSVTTFVVAPYGFQSHSQNIATVDFEKNKGNSYENIDLYLESIEPAADELKRIPSPVTATLFANDPARKE
ncbi:uncharacterized protein LOC103569447 isoform X1 [Microplitis demolitor]|uniref:uncharacterized protein LOC103569447 isoform X1 n=1 Tax=Microplitis demolitor TaxID=69319 RepID=UPI0004CD2E10|nr:uncharacterized protein LOC103569447 isoform X1 [Microplitis demolitor]